MSTQSAMHQNLLCAKKIDECEGKTKESLVSSQIHFAIAQDILYSNLQKIKASELAFVTIKHENRFETFNSIKF